MGKRGVVLSGWVVAGAWVVSLAESGCRFDFEVRPPDGARRSPSTSDFASHLIPTHFTEKRNSVVARKVSPGRRMTVGKLGWWMESG